MKKKCATLKRAYALIMTIMSFLFLWQNGMSSCAKETVQASAGVPEEADRPPDSLIRIFELTSGETAQVPRRIVEGSAVYELDEASITVEVSGSGSAEGADVVTYTKNVEDLSDNDLSKIEKTAVFDGISCELLSVTYKVEEEEESGMPRRYSAACRYGGLKKYSTSYPAAWRMTARYNLCETVAEKEVVTMWEETKEDAARHGEGNSGTGSGESETVGGEEEPVPKAIKGGRIKPGPEEGDTKKIPDFPVPLAVAAAVGAGLTVPFIIWISILTAPLYGLKEAGKYRYIGQIRLKKDGETYAAYLTKRLFARAELPVFQIRLPKRVRRKANTGMLRVDCPEGKRIMATMGRIVCFTVEGD